MFLLCFLFHSRYWEILTPQDVAFIITATPRLAPPPPPASPPTLTAMQARALGPWRAQRNLSARQAEYERSVREHRDYVAMAKGLAELSLRHMGQYTGAELAEMIYALTHAGAMDEDTAAGFLSHASTAAAAGQLDVDGLAGVLAALAAAG